MRKIFAGIAFLLLLIGGWLALAAPTAAQSNTVLVLEIEGPVTPAMASYFDRGIQAGEEQDATAVLILLDTPGGAIDITLEIVQSFRAADVPVIVYVSPAGGQAASAGSIITLASHLAAMAPDTTMGAASPVGEGGAELGETISRKIIEDLTAQMRNLTAGRPPEAVAVAEAMISEAKAVNAREALAIGLIDIIAADTSDLLAQADGRSLTINGQTVTLQTAAARQETFNMNIIEAVLHALSNPLLLSILMVIGVQGILIELGSPGGWVAGFVGVLSLSLGLYGLGVLQANWLGLGLIAVAFVLFALEVKTPAVGGLALAGTGTLLAGLLVLFNSPSTPEFARISLPSALFVSLATAAFFIFILTKALQAQRAQPRTGAEGLVGGKGVVRTALTAATEDSPPTGMVLLHGELWRATAEQPIPINTAVKVTVVTGFTVTVVPASED